jgi:CMP-N-acetylneuraminic acid synthetase
VVVSTDDANIAAVAKQHGADVPFLRPAALAADESPMIDSIVHALDFLEQRGERFDILVILEPTSPLREKDDLSRAMENFANHQDTADALISLGEIHMESPFVAKQVDASGYVVPVMETKAFHQRQQLPAAYFPYGVIYASKVATLRKDRTFYQKRTLPHFIKRHQNYEIDDLMDFICVEAVMRSREGVPA